MKRNLIVFPVIAGILMAACSTPPKEVKDDGSQFISGITVTQFDGGNIHGSGCFLDEDLDKVLAADENNFIRFYFLCNLSGGHVGQHIGSFGNAQQIEFRVPTGTKFRSKSEMIVDVKVSDAKAAIADKDGNPKEDSLDVFIWGENSLVKVDIRKPLE